MTTDAQSTSRAFAAGAIIAAAGVLGLAWLGQVWASAFLACLGLGALWYAAVGILLPPQLRAAAAREARIAELESGASEVSLAVDSLVKLAASLAPADRDAGPGHRRAAPRYRRDGRGERDDDRRDRGARGRGRGVERERARRRAGRGLGLGAHGRRRLGQRRLQRLDPLREHRGRGDERVAPRRLFELPALGGRRLAGGAARGGDRTRRSRSSARPRARSVASST